MNYEPLKDFYCVPQSEEEAKEIIERAVAHGAELCIAPSSYGPVDGVQMYCEWNGRQAWGVYNNETDFISVERAGRRVITIDELRKECPFVSELNEGQIISARSGHMKETMNSARRALAVAGGLERADDNQRKPWFKNETEKEEFIKTGIEAGHFIVTNIADDNSSETLSVEAKNYLDSFEPVPDVNTASRGAGLKFDTGKPQMRLVPPHALLEMSKVMTFGAEKYEADSWRQVENAEDRYLDALYRHLNAWSRGETLDEDSGLSHMAHIMCNAAFLYELAMETKE